MAKYYANYFERWRLEALMGHMERNSGCMLIAYEWGHVAFIGNVGARFWACHPTPHPHCIFVEQEREHWLPQSGFEGFWAIWVAVIWNQYVSF